MRVRFDEQLEKLNVMMIDMGALCEEAITYAVKALETGSSEMRKKLSVRMISSMNVNAK